MSFNGFVSMFLVCVQGAAVIAAYLIYEAENYIREGIGIHPIAATALAVLLLVVPHAIAWFADAPSEGTADEEDEYVSK